MSNATSAMGDFLQQHAYRNVWCTPGQDKQTILRPARVTEDGGTWNSVRVGWRTHKLPDLTSRFHVYQIGQIHPMLLGLLAKQGQWLKVSDVCNAESLIADIYVVSGLQLPRAYVWYLVTQEKNLIIAVKIPEYARIPVNLNDDELFIRLYSNAYFQSYRADGANDVVHVEGKQAVVPQDVLSMQSALATWKDKPTGMVYCFVNGWHVDTIDMITAKPGDYIEFVYDGSIKSVVTWNINELHSFPSELDAGVSKYLLHYQGTSDLIDYQDDIDIFLIKPRANMPTRFKGVYYHKNNETAVRMVTHKDYSVPVSFLASYPQQLPALGNVEDLKLVMHIRHGGYNRPLVDEHNRIKDLYKMSDADIMAAMLGIDSTVSVWNASALENSGYTKMMRAPEMGDITLQDVQDGYGYNAVSKILGDTPFKTKITSGQRFVDVPAGLQLRSTAYEYDANGLLLEWHHHTGGAQYVALNPATRLVEMIFGFASEDLLAVWDQRTQPIDPNFNYRMYTCGRSGGSIDNNWVDVTDSSEYAIVNGTLSWVNNQAQRYTLVRNNKNHLLYSINALVLDGILTFSLREYRSDIGANRVMGFPLGEMDVFLNKKSLVPNVDYIVDFPRVTIINKEYLDDPLNKTQEIVIRHSGFADADLQVTYPGDVGFVQYGVLSFNNRYDIREDKVNRIVVDGALYRYDELEFGEEDFAIRVSDAKNGSPYSIRDIVVPMNSYLVKGSTQDPTYTLRERSRLVDEEISDYLTLKIPEKEPENPSAIPQLYPVVSPFFCKIIYDLKNGALWEEKFVEHYSDDYVREVCEEYAYLLEWDPVTDARRIDPRFVIVHPHNLNTYISLGIYQYKFLSRVNKLYGSGRIDLSSAIQVEQF